MKSKHWISAAAIVLLITGIFLRILGIDTFSSGDYSLNYFAAGDFACGVFAVGKFSIGIFSIGIFSIGVFSLGIFNIGLYAIGIFVIAKRKKLPCIILDTLKSEALKTKIPLIILLFLLVPFKSFSQDDKNFKLAGGFGGPILTVSFMSSNPSISFGGGGAMVFRNGVLIGGFGAGTSDLLKVDSELDGYQMKTEYGGIWLGYLKGLKSSYRISGSIQAGLGEAQLDNKESKQLFYDNLAVISPQISISKRLNGFSSIDFALIYSIFTGIDFHQHENDNFNNLSISMMYRFGGGYF